jgi:AraC-like DNA-binding protein
MGAGQIYMPAGRSSQNLDWLIYPNSGSAGTNSGGAGPDSGGPVRLRRSLRLDAQRDGWALTSEQFTPRPGLLVFLNRLRAERPFVLEPAKDPALDHHQAYTTVLAQGRSRITTLDGRRDELAPDHGLAYTLAGPTAKFDIPAGADILSLGVTLYGPALEGLLADRTPQALVRLVEGRSRNSDLVGWAPPARVRALARAAFAAPYDGPLRELYVEGVALQLLALQASALDERGTTPRRRALSRRERAAVAEARERLLADMRRPPSLGELADAVGLTPKRLNEGFRVLFGETVFEVLREERLAQARRVLEEAEDAPLKQIAWRVGYRHVTNFITAFIHHFGEAPGRARRRAHGR